MFRIVLGGIVGAVIAFVWSFVSWTVLPWHDWAMNKFVNEEFVTRVIKENAPKDGVYVSPYMGSDEANLTKEEVKQNIDRQREAMAKGPFIYTQIKTKGIDPSSPQPYIISFLTQFVGTVLISLLLLQAGKLGYGGRLLFVVGIGLIVGILGFVPDWNWLGGSYKFTLVMIGDLLLNWFLVGLFLAAFFKPKGEGHGRERMM